MGGARALGTYITDTSTLYTDKPIKYCITQFQTQKCNLITLQNNSNATCTHTSNNFGEHCTRTLWTDPATPSPMMDSWLSRLTIDTIRSSAVACSNLVFSTRAKHLGVGKGYTHTSISITCELHDILQWKDSV